MYVSSLCHARFDWYPCIVNIESEGFYPPQRLLPEAIAVMRAKIATIKRATETLLNNGDGLGDVEMAGA